MNFDYLIAIISIFSSLTAVIIGLRFYFRFGRRSGQWGWLLMTLSSVSLAMSELIDGYSTFQGGGLTELSDVFATLTELFLIFGFIRLFNREINEDKIRRINLETNLKMSEDLLSATKQMAASLNLEETLRTLLQRTIVLSGADLAAIYLSEKSGKLAGKYFISRRHSDQIVVDTREFGAITQQVLTTGDPILIENLREYIKNTSVITSEKLAALGGFPLKEKGEIFGVLFVVFDKVHKFATDQQLLLLSIADHGALALRNAELYERVEELALNDPLTGLANRRLFDKTLANELTRARRYDNDLSLILLDVDHFKRINDTWGHTAGDEALKHIAKILQENQRLADVVARVGGDEIALILPETDTNQARQLAERLRREINQTPFAWDETIISLTCSFGIEGGKGNALPKEPARLYELADSALYRAKEEGRNRVTVHETTQPS